MFRALEQLYALGALNDKGELTTLGEGGSRSLALRFVRMHGLARIGAAASR